VLIRALVESANVPQFSCLVSFHECTCICTIGGSILAALRGGATGALGDIAGDIAKRKHIASNVVISRAKVAGRLSAGPDFRRERVICPASALNGLQAAKREHSLRFYRRSPFRPVARRSTGPRPQVVHASINAIDPIAVPR